MSEKNIDWEMLARRLLALGELGAWLGPYSGHVWINSVYLEHEESDNLFPTLKRAGIELERKHYRGVIDTLDKINSALFLAGEPTLDDEAHDVEEWAFPDDWMEDG